jgi:hypothetical protein
MKWSTLHVVGIIFFVSALVWVYEANPYNVFQRGNTPASA